MRHRIGVRKREGEFVGLHGKFTYVIDYSNTKAGLTRNFHSGYYYVYKRSSKFIEEFESILPTGFFHSG